MGTVPRDTYSIFIEEFQLPVTLDQLTEEIQIESLKVMKEAELMPGE